MDRPTAFGDEFQRSGRLLVDEDVAEGVRLLAGRQLVVGVEDQPPIRPVGQVVGEKVFGPARRLMMVHPPDLPA